MDSNRTHFLIDSQPTNEIYKREYAKIPYDIRIEVEDKIQEKITVCDFICNYISMLFFEK